MYEIPQSILIDNQEFSIRNKGDYRMVLDCMLALNDVELSKVERIAAALIIFYEDLNGIEDLSKLPDENLAIEEMFKFFNCGQPESPGTEVNYKLIDWERDSQLISSAINSVAGKEIRLENYIHWWTFMGYYLAIGDGLLTHIISIRSKLAKGKKLEKYELEFKRDNPQYFNWDARTLEQKQNDELLKQVWNAGK